MFNSSSKADTNQAATSGDYDTQTYLTKSKPIKLDVNKQTKQQETKQEQKRKAMELSSSPASLILGKFSKNNDANTSVVDRSNPTSVVQEPQQDYNANELIPFYRNTSTPLKVQTVSVQPSETTPVAAQGGLSPNEKVFKVFNEIKLEPETCKKSGGLTSNKCKYGSFNLKAWEDSIRRKIFKDEAIVDVIFEDEKVKDITIKNKKFSNLRTTLLKLDENWNQNKDIPDAVWDKLQAMYEESKKVNKIKEGIEEINRIITNSSKSKVGGSSDEEETTKSLTEQIKNETKFTKIKELVKQLFKIMTPEQKQKLKDSEKFNTQEFAKKLDLSNEEIGLNEQAPAPLPASPAPTPESPPAPAPTSPTPASPTPASPEPAPPTAPTTPEVTPTGSQQPPTAPQQLIKIETPLTSDHKVFIEFNNIDLEPKKCVKPKKKLSLFQIADTKKDLSCDLLDSSNKLLKSHLQKVKNIIFEDPEIVNKLKEIPKIKDNIENKSIKLTSRQWNVVWENLQKMYEKGNIIKETIEFKNDPNNKVDEFIYKQFIEKDILTSTDNKDSELIKSIRYNPFLKNICNISNFETEMKNLYNEQQTQVNNKIEKIKNDFSILISKDKIQINIEKNIMEKETQNNKDLLTILYNEYYTTTADKLLINLSKSKKNKQDYYKILLPIFSTINLDVSYVQNRILLNNRYEWIQNRLKDEIVRENILSCYVNCFKKFVFDYEYFALGLGAYLISLLILPFMPFKYLLRYIDSESPDTDINKLIFHILDIEHIEGQIKLIIEQTTDENIMANSTNIKKQLIQYGTKQFHQNPFMLGFFTFLNYKKPVGTCQDNTLLKIMYYLKNTKNFFGIYLGGSDQITHWEIIEDNRIINEFDGITITHNSILNNESIGTNIVPNKKLDNIVRNEQLKNRELQKIDKDNYQALANIFLAITLAHVYRHKNKDENKQNGIAFETNFENVIIDTIQEYVPNNKVKTTKNSNAIIQKFNFDNIKTVFSRDRYRIIERTRSIRDNTGINYRNSNLRQLAEKPTLEHAQTTIQKHLNLPEEFKWNTNYVKKQINDEYLKEIIYLIDNEYFEIKEMKDNNDPNPNRTAMEGYTGYQYNLEQMEEPGDKTVVNIPIRS